MNTVSSCEDPTLGTFLDHFDPIQYAPTQHGPVLTIIGSHDQYFTVPAINSTFDRVRSAGTSERFRKRIVIVPNGEHGVFDEDDELGATLPLLGTINGWLRYGLGEGTGAPGTPSVEMTEAGEWMIFKVEAARGGRKILAATLASPRRSTPLQPLPAIS